MYIVHNTTDKIIVLGDLRAEIGPRGVLDLEKVANRSDIESSKHLEDAMNAKILMLGRHSIIRTKEVYTPQSVIVQKKVDSLDENKIAEVVRSVIKHEMQATAHNEKSIHDTVKSAVAKGIDDMIGTIREKINAVSPADAEQNDELKIDPEKIAAISQAAIDKLGSEIDSGKSVMGKKYKITKNVRDLANDL